ncbi:glycosyl transferase, group 1 [Mariniradius saccharolyticus AK6]|uniref:Glycosyl transferase, group 1 n=2 Tax=Mariniradius TaxID=1245590 RepID=M7XBT6_9BACT|nr:glycosyl transferase, group 1 [Mariniradius saccharolyticus AK6]
MKLIWEIPEPTGGASVQSLVWMSALNQLGNKVFLGRLSNDNKTIDENYRWINFLPLYDSLKKQPFIWFTYRFPSIFRIISRNRIDIVYTSMPTWQTFYIGLICKVLGVKHVIRIASDVNVDGRLKKHHPFPRHVHISLAYRLADLVIAQNNYQFTSLKGRVKNSNLIKIPNPFIITKKYYHQKKSLSGSIVWVANFRRVKNMGRLLEICRLMPYEDFKIAGVELPNMDDETAESISLLKSLPNVTFFGNISRSKILDFYAESKFLLNTSDFEGFSNTFLEAMATGTPILSTTMVNPDGIINKYQLGIVYEDEISLRDSLDRLSLYEYLEYSKNCLAYVKEFHDHLALGNKLNQTFEKMMPLNQ